MVVGENHVGLAISLARLMPELYILGSGACIVSVFLERREASMGEGMLAKCWPFLRL